MVDSLVRGIKTKDKINELAGKVSTLESLQVDSISDLYGLTLEEGSQVSVTGYHTGTTVGGGMFVYGTGRHNGGTVIDPTRSFPADWDDQSQLEDWFADSGVDVVGFRRIYDGLTKVTDFGAVGVGVTDSTYAIQAAIDSGSGSIYIPDGTYYVSSLQLRGNLKITGESKRKSIIQGDGTSSVFNTGTYPSGDLYLNRNIDYSNFTVSNTSFPCIKQYTAVNFSITDCIVTTSGANGIEIRFSFRGFISNCFINTGGGAYYALDIQDNCNGILVQHNTVSAGRGGASAISVGQSQSVQILSNIIESSGALGIALGTTSGNCNGVTISDNYIEATDRGISIGEVYFCQGVTVTSNYFGSIGAASPTYGIRIGRVNGAHICDNYLDLSGAGTGIELYYSASGSVKYGSGLTIKQNLIYAPSQVAYTGSWIDAFKEVQSGSSFIQTYDASSGSYTTVCKDREVKIDIDMSEGLASILVAVPTFPTSGGKVKRAYITNASGTLFSSTLAIGSSTNSSEVLSIDVNTIALTSGYAELTTSGDRLRNSGLQVSLPAAGIGTFTLNLELNY